MIKFAVIIPAYRPMAELPAYIEALILEQVKHILVIDDGSGPKYQTVFEEIRAYDQCTVLVHEENKGKGAALRTGFLYVLNHYSHLVGVVTADADGQHLVNDVLKVGEQLEKISSGFVLGSRVFKKNDMPLRSWVGNRLTSFIFKLFFGKFIRDTQTGLRGIATAELDWVIQLRGDHFEYEMNMLIQMIKREKRIVRVDIAAIYGEDYSSHFEAFKDTKLITRAILSHYFNPIE